MVMREKILWCLIVLTVLICFHDLMPLFIGIMLLVIVCLAPVVVAALGAGFIGIMISAWLKEILKEIR